MRFDILTLFPGMFQDILNDSILGRAQQKGILEFHTVNIRDFAGNKHGRVDDTPYGGGRGMVLMAPPVVAAYESVAEKCDKKPHTIYLSPKGAVLTQRRAEALAKLSHVVLLCGHYEGVDQRALDLIVDEEISIGDYVLTGGELPAMVLIDTVSRMLPGVLSCDESFQEESHFSGMLEYPHYTRPPEFLGRAVPEVLLSGNHAEIAKWRAQMAYEETRKKRPDLLK